MLKYEKEREKAAFKQMTTKEKLGHIRQYYTVHIIVALVALFVLGWCLNRFVFNPPKNPSLAICTVSDGYMNTDTSNVEAYLNELFPMLKTDRSDIQITPISLYADGEGTEYYTGQKLMALVAANSIDIFIGNTEVLAELAQNEFLYNLDEFLTDKEKAAFETLSYQVVLESDYMGRPTKVDGPYNLVIKLPYADWMEEIFGSNREICMGVVVNVAHTDAVHTILEYFMGLAS